MSKGLVYDDHHWVIGETVTRTQTKVPVISTSLIFQDTIGAWKARWGINCMSYTIRPGLYAVGQPSSESPVLVTANYKLTFDYLRSELHGLSAWVLVLDTKGINVWCAAGKGTFGTDELVERIGDVELVNVVSHKEIILPQLAAPGVAALEVLKRSGFRVVYGPVRAEDIKAFLQQGQKATKEMRTVRFTMVDRLVLIPLELSMAMKYLLLLFLGALIMRFLAIDPSVPFLLLATVGAALVGIVFVPLLLPYIPGRAFSIKGWLLGLVYTLALISFAPVAGFWRQLAYVLLLPPLSAFLALNFTGSSTYTSLSGVEREVKVGIRSMASSAALGAIVLAVSLIVRGG